MKKLNDGYSLASVILLLTFISFSLTLTITWVSFYLQNANHRVSKNTDWEEFYEVLYEIKSRYFEGSIRDEYTSPFDGWYSELPETVKEFKISYFPEDSKLDINHTDLSKLFKIENKSNDNTSDNNSDTDSSFSFTRTPDKYFYYSEDIAGFMDEKQYQDLSADIGESFSIYNVPNLNTAGLDRLKLFLVSQNFSDQVSTGIINKVKEYRQSLNYLKYRGTKSIQSGLIIDKTAFESLKNLKWPQEDSLLIFFDYKGRINLNFVSEKVFELCVNACGPDKVKYKDFWDKISSKRNSNVSIKANDLTDIFGYSYTGEGKDTENIRNWLYFEKIFSVDSYLFKIEIIKDDKMLTALLRKYKDREIKTKILKITVKNI